MIVDFNAARRRLRPKRSNSPPDIDISPPKGWWLNGPFLGSIVALCAMFLFAGAVISIVAWHLLAPTGWHWLSDDQLGSTYTLMFGAIAAIYAWLWVTRKRPRAPPHAPKPRPSRVRRPPIAATKKVKAHSHAESSRTAKAAMS